MGNGVDVFGHVYLSILYNDQKCTTSEKHC